MANRAASSLDQQQRQLNPNKDEDDETSTFDDDRTKSFSSLRLNGYSATDRSNSELVVYDVEHLATFSTSGNISPTNDNDEIVKSDTSIGKRNSATTPKIALQRLFELEKLSGIWTQHMQIELREDSMLIVDCETNSIVERFNRDCVTKPEAFNHYNDIYNNIVVFIIQARSAESDKIDPDNQMRDIDSSGNKSQKDSTCEGELHIFQCVSHEAQQIVSDILSWKSQRSSTFACSSMTTKLSDEVDTKFSLDSKSEAKKAESGGQKQEDNVESASDGNHRHKKESPSNRRTSPINSEAISSKPIVKVASSPSASEKAPVVNVNVKETVQVFNQIAALREKSKPTSPTNHNRPLSDAFAVSSQSTPASSTSVNGSTNSAAARTSLSPGSQMHKKRSIRATLAPKGPDGHSSHDHSSTCRTDQQSLINASSTNSSVASSEPKSSSHRVDLRHGEHKTGGHASSNNCHDFEQNAQMPANGIHGGSSTRTNSAGQIQFQNQSVNKYQANHKSAKSQSRAQQQLIRSQTDSSRSHASSSSQSQIDQVTTNESYVSVLNHCFDDIEKFIIRLQQAVAAIRDIQSRRKLSKRSNQTSNGNSVASKVGDPAFTKGGGGTAEPSLPMTAAELATLSARARGPNEDDYFEILSKFKLAFNLLAKLKGCIHEPNAPELVHFLFTPLAIIIESARNAKPPIDPTLVGIPYLNQDALDLLSNCCTSKESDLWVSLGPNWTQTIDLNLLKASRMPSSFQPIFSDGWAPIIGELELIGLVMPPSVNSAPQTDSSTISVDINDSHRRHSHEIRHRPSYMLSEPTCGTSAANGTLAIEHDRPGYMASVESGRLDGLKSHGHRRDHKKRIAPSPPHLHTSDPTSLHTYPSPVPYDYIHGSGIEGASTRADMHGRILHGPESQNIRNIRFGVPEEEALRKMKQRHSDYPFAPNYETPHCLPYFQQPIDEVNRLEHDFSGAQDVRADDYGELQERIFEDHRSKVTAGPSTHRHREDKGNNHKPFAHDERHKKSLGLYNPHPMLPPFEIEHQSEAGHKAMLLDLGPSQTEWFFELQARGAMIVRVLFTREANNDKELSVRRGELLEVLDNKRKWWRARNIELQVAHVPHTIVAVMQGYQTLDELLASNPSDIVTDDPNSVSSRAHSRRDIQPVDYGNWHDLDDQRSSRTTGAFRYF